MGKEHKKMFFHITLSRANSSVPVDDVEEPSVLLIMLKGNATLSSLSVVICMCVCYVASFCLTLCDPVDCRLPGSSVHGILQARILEWVAMPSFRGISPTQGLNSGLPHCR